MTEKLTAFGKKWLATEDEQLLKEISENLSHDEIAVRHHRTASAIKSRLLLLAYNMHKDNKTLEFISDKIKIGIAELKLYLDKKIITEKNKLEKLEKKDSDISLDTINAQLKEIFTELKEIKTLLKST